MIQSCGLVLSTFKNIGLQFLARGLSISHEIHRISWNPHEIWWISGEIHPEPYKFRCFNKNYSCENRCLEESRGTLFFTEEKKKKKNYSVWWMQERGYDLGFHEIWGHSPLHAPPKLKSFCWNIWIYKVWVDFTWNPPDFMNYELLCDDQV